MSAAAEKTHTSRLYVKGVVASFKRSKINQDNHTNILQLQGVQDSKAANFYLGKRVCYIYKAKTEKNGSKFRTIWGRVTRTHGTNGAVRAKFSVNLPSKCLGGPIRVMLYPSTI